MAKFRGMVGSSYRLHNTAYACERTLNLFPAVDEVQLGRGAEIAQLERTPGLTLLIRPPAFGEAAATLGAATLVGTGENPPIAGEAGVALGGVALEGTGELEPPPSSCPPPPETYDFDMAYVTPDGEYEWQVYVESRDEFWLINYDYTRLFIRGDADAGTSPGNIADATFENTYIAAYDPVYDKVWCYGVYDEEADDYDVVRIDVQTLTRDLQLALSPRGFPSYPLDICVNRGTGELWLNGFPRIYRVSPAGVQQEVFPQTAVGRAFSTPVVDAAGDCWAIDYDYNFVFDNVWNLVRASPGAGTVAIEYTLSDPEVGRSIAYLTYDALHDAVWMAVVVHTLTEEEGPPYGYDWEYRRFDIATGAVDLTITAPSPFWNAYIFDFDDVRNILWVNELDADHNRVGETPNFMGYCGDTGELVHSAHSGIFNIGDRSRLMFRRPGDAVFFDAYDTFNPETEYFGTGRYSWT